MKDNKSNSKKKRIGPLTEIKTGLFARSLSIAKLGLNAGLQYANTKINNTSIDDYIIKQAGLFTDEFGELKGSLMKAGQMLSMYGEYFLPPAANQLLKKLQSDSPAIEWATMKTYLEKYLDADLIDELEINPEPIGCASLGQVHLATIKATQEKIALKIQYPDVDKAIDSDISALKTILQLSNILPKGIDLKPVLDEIKSMLRQELDYKIEAELTRQYRQNLKGDPRFIVPKVYERYSNFKILATEYLEGFKADHALIQALSQERKNQLSRNFLDLYFKEIFEWNLVQTDPHLGNYKIQIDALGNDKIVLLDFGACRELNVDFIKSYRKMIKGSVLNDQPLFNEGCQGLGFIIEADSAEYVQVFTEFCNETVEPFWSYNDPRDKLKKISPDGIYNWKENDLPGRVIKKAFQFKKFDLRSPPKEIIFLDRKTGGVFIFLSVLNAQINARKIIDPYLTQV